MKRAFFAGLIVFLPIAITFFIARFLVDLFTAPFSGLIAEVLNEHSYNTELFTLIARLVILALLFFFILLLGYLTQRFFFKLIVKKADALIAHIPVIKSIYRITRDVTANFLSADKKPFKKTVLVKFPNEQSRALAFLTGEVPRAVQATTTEHLQSIFVPTAPHPISGYVVMCPEKALLDVDISIEEVFKMLVSAGLYEPEKHPQGDVLSS